MLFLAACIAALAGAPQQDSAAKTGDSAVRRIGKALDNPARLRIVVPPLEPTFRVEVRAHPFYTDIPPRSEFGGGVPTVAPQFGPHGSPPLVSFDVLPLLRAARRTYAQRAAKKEVQRALDEFCATHACEPR